MACGYSDNKKLINNKNLSLEDMGNMSIEEIVSLYKDGYSIDGIGNNVGIVDTNIVSMDFGSQCSGGSTLAFNNTGSLPGTSGAVQKGTVWAQRFNSNFRCLDFVQFSIKRRNNVDLYIEIRKDSGGKPQGVPAQNDAGLIYRTSTISYNDLPTSFGWVYINISTILPTNADYWICFVPVDFYDSPTYRTLAYDRFELQDGTILSANPTSYYAGGTWTNSSTFSFAVYKLPTYVAPSIAYVFNMCWGSGLGTSCTLPPQRPAIIAGTVFTIKADLSNNGATGKIRAVFKANGATITPNGDQNIASLATYPGGGLWSPTVSYTMPATDVTIVVDGYGWDGSAWVLTHTNSAIISSIPTCTGINLTPYSASIELGQSITFTATTTPSTQVFSVRFRLVETGTILDTRSTSGGTCQFTWNTSNPPGLVAGTTYHVIAEVVGQCQSTSPGSGITLSAPIRQWTLDVYTKEINTLANIIGASVTVSASGPPSGTQTLTTDNNAHAHFIVTEGSINVSISATGYNTSATNPDSLFTNKTNTYYLVPTTPNPGSLKFITVPTSAEVFFGTTSKGTTDPVTGYLQIDNLPAGQVVNYTVKKTGFNDSSGSVTVQSDTVSNVPVTLTPATPMTGDVCMKSNPNGASIKIDNVTQSGKTTAISGGGCTSSNIIYNLTPVQHSYELSLAGYQNKTGMFTPTAGATIDVDASTLTPSLTMGNVTITSTPPGARIYMDNVDQQFNTPSTITNVSQGSHTYKLVLTGYKDGTGSFDVTAGQTTTVPNVVLVQRMGGLNFISTPAGAEILIGNVSQGITTITGLVVSDLPIGLTDYVAMLANYDDYHGSVVVEEDITKDVTITLIPLEAGKGSLYIETTPAGAEIFIDGIDKNAVTPMTIPSLDTGGHTFELQKSGYDNIYGTFPISEGQTTTIIRTLQQTTGGGGAGGGMIFGLLGIAVLGIMMSSKTSPSSGGLVGMGKAPIE